MPRVHTEQYSNAIVPPIWTSAAFYFRDSQEARQYREGLVSRGRYGRYDNPSWLDVEDTLARLEDQPAALLFPSGMSAIATISHALVGAGDSVIYTRCGYRNIGTFFEDHLTSSGATVHGINQSQEAAFRQAFETLYTDKCRMVFVEMPSNPHLFLVDLDFILRSIDRRRTMLVVDSTFATPANFRPGEHGADLVVHSCTKYLSGDGDLLAGCVLGSETLIQKIRTYRNVSGAIPSGFTAFLLRRSLETFGLRMRHLNAAGLEVASALESHPIVRRVYYTGLDSHPQAALARRYLKGHGGVVSFELDLDAEQTSRFVDRLCLPYMGTNFGCHHAMVEQCAPFTFHKLSAEEREAICISDSLIRLSVGMHPADALIADINQALQ